MIINLLAQAERLNAFQKSVRDQFQEGGSIFGILLVIVLIVGVLVGAYVWSRRLERGARAGADLSPLELFETVVQRLDLKDAQRSILLYVAHDSHLTHPVSLLLCPKLFDRIIKPQSVRREASPTQSKRASTDTQPALPAAELAELRSALFPSIPHHPATT